MLSFFVFVFEAFDIPDVRFPAVDQFEAKFAVKVFHDPDVRQFSGFFVFDVDADPLLFSIEVLPDRRQWIPVFHLSSLFMGPDGFSG